jgi:hypothetical protein
MLFNSPVYGVFLVSVLVVFWALRTLRLARALFLTIASYGFYFYGTWDVAREQSVPLGPWGWSVLCLSIIFVGSSIDYWIGRALERTESPHRRRVLLLVSIVYYLGVLAVFKYWNFGIDAFVQVAKALGFAVSPFHLRLVLPFGISFFTFETMSYTIDVYRREIPACRRYLDYLLFVSFFPHLVAGPIVRPRAMLPQLAAVPAITESEQGRGLFLIAQGLAKKMVIGDFLAVAIVGLLASLAHIAKFLAARLPLHSTWRLTRWSGPDVPKPPHHDGPRRPVARRLVEFRHLGRTSWRRARGHADLAATIRRRQAHGALACARHPPDISLRLFRVDLLPRADLRARQARLRARESSDLGNDEPLGADPGRARSRLSDPLDFGRVAR